VLLEQDAADITRLATGWCREFGLTGPLVSPERLHIALWSFGELPSVPADLAERGRSAAASVSFRPTMVGFDSILSLGRTGGTGGKRPFVMRATDHAPTLQQIRSDIDEAMAVALPVRIRQRPGFEPHATLLHDSRAVEEHIVEPVRVMVRDVALVHGRPGRGGYDILGRWPIG
jgi:2'-5' RNA ligase